MPRKNRNESTRCPFANSHCPETLVTATAPVQESSQGKPVDYRPRITHVYLPGSRSACGRVLIALIFLLSLVDFALAQAADLKNPVNNGRKSEPTNAQIRQAAISADGKKAIAGDSEGTIRVWDLSNHTQLCVIRIPSVSHDQPRDFCYSFSRDGKFALVGIHNERFGWTRVPGRESLTLWDLTSGIKLRACDIKGADVYSVALSPDGASAVSSIVRETEPSLLKRPGVQIADGRSFISDLSFWATANKTVTATLAKQSPYGPLDFTPDGKSIVAVLKGPTPPPNEPQTWYVQRWHAGSGRNLGAKPMVDDLGTVDASCMAISPDCDRLAVGNSRGVTMWNLKTGKRAWLYTTYITRNGNRFDDWPVNSLAFSPDGLRLVAAGSGCGWLDGRGCGRGGMVVLDVQRGKPVPGFVGTADFVDFVSFTPDGRTIVGGSLRAAIGLWDAQTGKLTRTPSP